MPELPVRILLLLGRSHLALLKPKKKSSLSCQNGESSIPVQLSEDIKKDLWKFVVLTFLTLDHP